MCVGPLAPPKPQPLPPPVPPPEPEILAEVPQGQRAVKPAAKKPKRKLRSVEKSPGVGTETAGSEKGASIA